MSEVNASPEEHGVQSIGDGDGAMSETLFKRILCPNIRVGVRMRFLHPDSEGWVARRELCEFFRYIGLAPNGVLEHLLLGAGYRAQPHKKRGRINIVDYAGTRLDHGSSTCILNNPAGFSATQLELFKSFAINTNGQRRITRASIAAAANHFHSNANKFPSSRGSHILSFELSGLLHLYGQTDNNGERYFTLDDVDCLWKHSRFPDSWTPPAGVSLSFWQALKNFMALTLLRRQLRSSGGCPRGGSSR
ncbi:MAG TPA: hypothetical protein VIC26_05910 [Marinagarivorans sp.]